ncbi:ribonuclease H-like domain-containing protein [Tanacetum coccineum]
MAIDFEEIPEQEEEVNENFEELPFEEKLKIKTSIQDPPTNLELKPLPKHLEYAFLEKDSIFPVVISALLKDEEKKRLVSVLKNHKEDFAWKTSNILGNRQVKDNKIDLLVLQYEQFTILEEKSIDSGFARFNTIITSLKALDEGFSSKNYVRKFLKAIHPKWRANVTAIEESKDLSSLALDELISNLKVHEVVTPHQGGNARYWIDIVVMEKDTKIDRGKKERVKSIALKANKESSDDETSTSGSDDREYAMSVRNFKKFFRRKGKFVRQPREEKKSFRQRDGKKGKSDRKCFRYGDPNHLIGDCPKPPRNKDQKAFIGGSWSDSENEAEDKTNDETYYHIWEVIQNGNGPVSITTDTQGQIKVLPLRTAEEILARERERKAMTTLLMDLLEDHLAKFHKMTDAKEMWEAIKSRFGGNDESKKMQKYILKQQFEGFSISNSEGLHKGYDRTKPGVDSLSFDDLYNNLRVFENDVKGSTASSSSKQNVAFVSENTNSTNDVSTAYGVSNPFEQLDEFDLEEMDLKWQVAMRMKKFYKKTSRKLQFDANEPVGFEKTKVECYNCHKTGYFARECRTKGNQDNRRRDAWNSGNKDGRRSGKQEDSKALVTIDRECVDWTSHSEEEEDYALMACNSSGSDTEVTSCSNECKESYAKLKKLYDAQREQLSDASIEIKAYTQGLKKVEAQLVAHQQGQLWYEEKIRFMKIDLDDKTDVLTYHKKLLAEAQKEKEDLKAKVEKWHNSSKNLGKLLNTQMSANDKFGLGYGDHRYDGILSYENEVLQSVFMNKESELEKQPLYDRFVTAGGMHVVPPPMTGNYMPSRPDVEIDYSQFTYGSKQYQTTESETQTSDFDTCESDCSVETQEPLPEPTVNEPKVVSQPKVWSDAPIIEEYESDSEDEHVSLPTEEQETPSFANQQVKSPRETVKNQFTHSKNPTIDKKGLGYRFTARACFVCGSLSHLTRDYDFHEKMMVKQAELNNRMKRNSSQKEIRLI